MATSSSGRLDDADRPAGHRLDGLDLAAHQEAHHLQVVAAEHVKNAAALGRVLVHEARRIAVLGTHLAGDQANLDVQRPAEHALVDEPLDVLRHGMVAVRISDQHLDAALVHGADHLGQVGGRSGELFLHEEVLAGLGQLDAGRRDLVGRHRHARHIEVLVGDHVVQARVDARFRIVLLRRVEQARVGLLAVGDDLEIVQVLVHVDEPRLGGAYGPHVPVPESHDRYLEGVLIRHAKTPWKAAWTSVPSRPDALYGSGIVVSNACTHTRPFRVDGTRALLGVQVPDTTLIPPIPLDTRVRRPLHARHSRCTPVILAAQPSFPRRRESRFGGSPLGILAISATLSPAGGVTQRSPFAGMTEQWLSG